MCVGFTNGYGDFDSKRTEDAIRAAIPGSAVGFNRIGFYHFAIFLGWAWPKRDNSEHNEPIPLLCHLSGDANTVPKVSVRLDDFRDIVQKCTIRVYSCSCTARKRSEVILECLYRVGKAGYNPITNNCEHFVREVILGKRVSYQSRWTLAAPVLQIPRLLAGSVLVGAATSSASLTQCTFKFEDDRSLGLLDAEMHLIEIRVSNSGMNLKGVKINSSCTREFGGSDQFPMQLLTECGSCSSDQTSLACRFCQKYCHKNCRMLASKVRLGVCNCSHDKRLGEALQLPLRSDADGAGCFEDYGYSCDEVESL